MWATRSRKAVITTFYDGALDPVRWPEAMRALAQAIGVPNGLFYVLFTQRMAPAHADLLGHTDLMQREYVQHYHALDPHLRHDVARAAFEQHRRRREAIHVAVRLFQAGMYTEHR